MKKTWIIGLIALGLMFMQPLTLEAGGHGCSKGKSSKCKVSKIKNKVKLLWSNKESLKLTEDQLNKIKDIKHQAMKDLIQSKADVDIIKVDVKAAMWAETIDLKSTNTLIDQKYAAKNKVAKTYAKAISDIQQVLNEEQRAKAHELAVKDYITGSSCSKGGSKICPITGKSLK